MGQQQLLKSFTNKLEKLTKLVSSVVGSTVDFLTEPTKGGESRRLARKLNLPCFGETPTDVILFVASAMSFRVYLWWRQRRGSTDNGSGKTCWWKRTRRNSGASESFPVKSTPLPECKDRGLYEFMNQAKEQKAKLKRVQDPEAVRRKKLKEIRNSVKPSGPLELSNDLLKDKRGKLKETKRYLVDEADRNGDDFLV